MSLRHVAATAAAGLFALSGAALAQAPATASIDLNLRSGPGQQFPIVSVIPSTGNVTIIGCAPDSSWCQVNHNGVQGWAFSNYLTANVASGPVIVGERRSEINVPIVRYEDDAGTTAVGAAGGAVAGAIAGGPVGAAVGTATGALLGEAADVPEPVVTYVRQQARGAGLSPGPGRRRSDRPADRPALPSARIQLQLRLRERAAGRDRADQPRGHLHRSLDERGKTAAAGSGAAVS